MAGRVAERSACSRRKPFGVSTRQRAFMHTCYVPASSGIGQRTIGRGFSVFGELPVRSFRACLSLALALLWFASCGGATTTEAASDAGTSSNVSQTGDAAARLRLQIVRCVSVRPASGRNAYIKSSPPMNMVPSAAIAAEEFFSSSSSLVVTVTSFSASSASFAFCSSSCAAWTFE